MNNSYFKRIFKIFLMTGIVLLMPMTVLADCPSAEDALKQGDMNTAVFSFAQCAVNENDEDSQFWLGRFYQNKQNPEQKDVMKMLLFYHLAAENGNANAQVALAKILMKMDAQDETRSVLSSYMEQMRATMKEKNMPFKGEMLHPYLLLVLAQEDAGQKWYYPTTQKTNTEAKLILQTYQIPEEKRKTLLREGSLWKQRKMQETAYEVLTASEYETFMNTVYPTQGRADAFTRQAAINGLKERVEEYLK